MSIENLDAVVNKYQESLEEKSGKAVVFSPKGPADMSVIHALVETIVEQAARIDELERRTTIS